MPWDGPYIEYARLVALGKIEHLKGRLRCVRPKWCTSYVAVSPVDRLRVLLWPWRVVEYPGYRRMLADILDVTPGHAGRLKVGGRVLGREKRERLIAWIEGTADELYDIASEMRREGEQREALGTVDPAQRMAKARAAKAAKRRRPAPEPIERP